MDEISVPLLKDNELIGAISIYHQELHQFSHKEIALVENFASQAVIAIENARLFKELQARTNELTRSVDQLTALGEISQAVSSTLDLPTVLTTIVARGTYAGYDTEQAKVPVEIFAKAPAARTTIVHTRFGDSVRTYDGRDAWIASAISARSSIRSLSILK